MGINNALPIPLFVNSVRTSGNKSNLGVGEMMIVDLERTIDGSLAYASNLNKDKRKKSYRIDVGATKRVNSKSSHQGDKTTTIFSLGDIKELKIAYPTNNDFVVDEWIVGFNAGNDDSTSLDFRNVDEALVIVMELCGGSIPYSGGGSTTERVVVFQPISEILPYASCSSSDPCDTVPCKDIVLELVERMRKQQISGGRELQELVEITPIFSCDQEEGTSEFTFWTLSICDLGDTNALSAVQSQISTPVKRINRNGSVSTYQTVVESSVTPSDVTITPNSIMADCDECPDNYTQEQGGFVYSYTKVDTSTTPAIIAIPGQVSGTNIFQGRSEAIATFTVKTTSALTSSQINTLIVSNPTMTIDLIGEVATFCNQDGVDYEWIEGDTCNASTRQYIIDLPDTDCGNDRLSELQSAYSGYTITLAPSSANITTVATLAGTSGSGNFTINGTNYLATYDTSLTVTATNFVSAHSAAITALGGTVSALNGVITFVLPANIGAPTYTSVAGLTATLSSTTAPTGVGCRNQYIITVPTNIVCEECSPAFKDFYTSEEPRPFLDYRWTPYNTTPSSGECSCGIRIRGKRWELNPDSCIEGKVSFIEDSVGIKVDAGYVKTMSGYTDLYTAGIDYKAVHKERVTWKKGRDMLGGNLKPLELQSEMHFTNMPFSYNPVERKLLGKESIITDNFAQYAKYSLVVMPSKFSQSFAHQHNTEGQSYDFYVPIGQHSAVENELKRLAAKAGALIGEAQP